jgi:FkbM family methyltransferase
MDAHIDGINAAKTIWADSASQAEYVKLVGWLWTAECRVLPPPFAVLDDYVPRDLFDLTPEHTFVDCGAYAGDTLRAYLASHGPVFKRWHSVEPDPNNFCHLVEYCNRLDPAIRDKVSVHQACVGAAAGRVRFDADSQPSAHVTPSGWSESEVVTLDGLLTDSDHAFIKMDVEGAEMDALRGAERILTEGKAIWAITLYHRLGDLWNIPLYVRAKLPKARLYLRRYAEAFWETRLYVLPEMQR